MLAHLLVLRGLDRLGNEARRHPVSFVPRRVAA
jgi:hypothetical protein